MTRAAWRGVVGAAALALCTLAQGAAPEARATYKATMKQANADYTAARAHCRTLKGHERSVCIAEAKGTLRKAEGDATAALNDTERARSDARVTAAKADYLVDKAKCGDRSGDARKACIKEARARQAEATAEAVKAERAPTAAASAKAPAIPRTKTP